jgi:hypothetical protein
MRSQPRQQEVGKDLDMMSRHLVSRNGLEKDITSGKKFLER